MRPTFEKSLKSIVQPALREHNFDFNGKRDFVRENGGVIMTVNFQLGQRALAGKFTVNLEVGAETERLGCVRENWWSGFIYKLFGENDPWWKGAFLPKDKWWRISDSEASMDRTMREVLSMLEAHGLPWLERHST